MSARWNSLGLGLEVGLGLGTSRQSTHFHVSSLELIRVGVRLALTVNRGDSHTAAERAHSQFIVQLRHLVNVWN